MPYEKVRSKMVRLYVGILLFVVGSYLSVVSDFDSDLLTLFVSFYGFLTVGDVAVYFFDNKSRQRRMDRAASKVSGGGRALVDLSPVLKSIEEHYLKLDQKESPVAELPESFLGSMNTQRNNSALVAQGIALLVKKVDHLTTQAGFEPVNQK